MTEFPRTNVATGDIAPTGEFSFYASRGEFAKMLVKFMFLQVITLGIYRFWAKTHIRRYLWSATELMGDRFEYLGTAKELFIGFLIAVAVLVPLGMLSNAAQTFLGVDSILYGLFNFVYLGAVFFLINFAVFRLWRYRLTRTSWRGIRFGLQGSASKYALWAIGWGVLIILTLGIAYPWAKADLIKYRIDHALIGSNTLKSTLTGRQIFLYYFVLIAGLLITYGAVIAVIVMSSAQLGENNSVSNGSIPTEVIKAGLMPIIFIGVSLLILPAVFVWVQVKVMCKTINSISSGECQFSSNVEMRKILPSVFKFMFAVFVMQLVIGLVAYFALSSAGGVGAIIPILLFALAMLSVGVLFNIIVGFTVMKELINGISVSNPEILEKIVMGTGEVPSRGEGFADAFDVGAF